MPKIFQKPPSAPCPTEMECASMPRVRTQASSAASAAPRMSNISPACVRLMAHTDYAVLTLQGALIFPFFLLAVLVQDHFRATIRRSSIGSAQRRSSSVEGKSVDFDRPLERPVGLVNPRVHDVEGHYSLTQMQVP